MKLKSVLTKVTALAAAAVIGIGAFSLPVLAEGNVPYTTYNYNYWGDIVYTPAAYEPDKVVTGGNLIYNGESIGNFFSPQDICVSDAGLIYLADTGNNRIVVMDGNMSSVINIIDSFSPGMYYN